MGKIIPFPLKKKGEKNGSIYGELTDTLIREKILAGEAELVGIFEDKGHPCSCYKLEFDNQTYYIFDLTSWR